MSIGQKSKKYYLGLDIGTESVGFAVTDQNYHLIRKADKHLWGVRLFPEANTAKERRTNRASRRRLERRRYRIELLRTIFQDDIAKLDSTFFQRLDSSFVTDGTKNPPLIFPEDKNAEKNYYRNFPTIYHLRKHFMQSDEPADPRLVYLAIAHIIKYRGNFLQEGELGGKGGQLDSLISLFERLDSALVPLAEEDQDPLQFKVTKKQASSLLAVFQGSKGKKERLEEIKIILGIDKKDKAKETICSCFNGNEVKASKLFPRLLEDADFAKTSLPFAKEEFEDELDKLPLGEDERDLVLVLKEIYDTRVLNHLLKGKESLSEAMVDIYDEHRKDLVDLKSLLIRIYGKKSQKVQQLMNGLGDDALSYARYVGTALEGKDRHPISLPKMSEAEYGKFFNAIKDALHCETYLSGELPSGLPVLDASQSKALKRIAERIESGDFLRKQNNKSNGVLPYQLNQSELVAIIEKQSKYLPILAKKAKGYPNPEKEEYELVSLLRFRIPYYVGPLGGEGKNHWAVFKEEKAKVTPWNFFDIVDDRESQRKFIENLKNGCAYLLGETTLPKFSLVYQAYLILNELNNLSVEGLPIAFEDKEYLIENVYLKSRNVGIKALKDALKSKYGRPIRIGTKKSDDEEKVSDILKTSFGTYHDLIPVFGEGFIHDMDKASLAEKVIEALTVFEDQRTKEAQLRSLGFADKNLSVLLRLRYKGWGRLSRKILLSVHPAKPWVDGQTGELLSDSIIMAMWKTNMNFMEIYADPEKGYLEEVKSLNDAYVAEHNMDLEEYIDEARTSPAMKRSLRQTIKVVKELQDILGIDSFDKVFVETTREKGEKKRTSSRKNMISEALGAAKQVCREEAEMLAKELDGKTDTQLKDKRLFLYFMQLGRDVYTGKPIDLERLEKDYDIDHIIPQAMLKDDSFSNMVLVASSKNRAKGDEYPIPKGILEAEGHEWIEKLSKISMGNKGYMMPPGKRDRLLRSFNNPLSDEEMTGFVNRQLVMTSQSAKAACEIIQGLYPNAEVVYSKARLVSDFRNEFGLLKVRELNNFHHANDAYLNIVVGNVYSERFSSRMTAKFLEYQRQKDPNYSLKTNAYNVFKADRQNRARDGYIWYAGTKDKESGKWSGGSYETVRKVLSWNDPMVSRMLYTSPGLFNKVSIAPKGQKILLKRKQSGPYAVENSADLYGGYKDLTIPYFVLVEIKGKGGKLSYSLEGIPMIYIKAAASLEDAVAEYLGTRDFKIIIEKVLIRTIIEMPTEDPKHPVRLAISGKTGTSIICINLTEPRLSLEQSLYLRDICKLLGTNLPPAEKPKLDAYQDVPCDGEIRFKGMVFNAKMNDELYSAITALCALPCYGCIPGISNSLRKIDEIKYVFQKLSLLEQIRVIQRLYTLLSCKSVQQIDLRPLGLSKNVGAITISKNLKPGIKIKAVSSTGFYERVVFTIPGD